MPGMNADQIAFFGTFYGAIAAMSGVAFTIRDIENSVNKYSKPISRTRAEIILRRSTGFGIFMGIIWPALLLVGSVWGITWVLVTIQRKIISAWATKLMNKVNGPPDLRESVHARAITGGVDRHRST